MATINGGEAVVRMLMAAGVDTLFGINGAHVDSIYQSSLDHGLTIVDTRHEMNAGHGAEGYARVRNSLGVALLTAGGGFTNGITSMANARMDRTPVLYIAGSGMLTADETNTLQAGIDQVAIAAPLMKWAHRVTRPDLIPRILARAVRTALDGPRGPVLLDFPWDVLRGELEEPDLGASLLHAPAFQGAAPSAAVGEILTMLAAAQRPVIVVGSELVRAGGTDDLRAFAALADVPVFADYEGLSAATGTPLGFGLVQSLFGLQEQSPDLVIMLGVRFGLGTAHGSGKLIPPTARVVQVDPEARELGHLQRVDLPIAADPAATVRELRLALTDGPPTPDRSGWKGALHAHIDHRRVAVGEVARKDPDEGRIHPYDAVRAIADAVPAGSIVCADGALTYLWLSETIPEVGVRAYLCHGYFGTMGLGMGVALGAQAAARDEVVVLVTGDGAIGYSLGEFDSMVREGLPVVVVILNNRAWGATLHVQQFRGKDRVTHNRLENGSYHEVAVALGANGYVVDDLADLGATIAKAIADRHPACIEVMVGLDPFPPEERMMFSGKPF